MSTNPVARVVDAGLCTGCGLCRTVYGPEKVTIRINAAGFLRPEVNGVLPAERAAEFEAVCPGRGLALKPEAGATVHPLWGPLRTVQAGWALDGQVRFRGSSGGAITALAAAMLERGEVDFVAHVEASPDHPLRNRLRLSRTPNEVLSAAGSRYGPSAPLERLDELLATGQKFAFVGKPCDAAALRMYLRQHPEKAGQVGAIFAFMCAGVPSERGSEEVLKRMGTSLAQVDRFVYRGNGWPGKATATLRDGTTREMDYATSWGTVLNRHLQFRCKLCPDGTGEFADVVGADAWYGESGYPEFEERDGRSLILARTTLGERVVNQALAAGRIAVQPCDANEIEKMQPYQVSRKRLLASRILAVMLGGRRWPRYAGLRLLSNALALGPLAHLRNLAGTYKRLPGTGGL